MDVSRRGFIGTLAAAGAALTMPLTRAVAARTDRPGFYQYGRYYGRVDFNKFGIVDRDGAFRFGGLRDCTIVGVVIENGKLPRWMSDREYANISTIRSTLRPTDVSHWLVQSDTHTLPLTPS